MPAVLETKKRYVGMAFETRDDEHGTFDAKGIETVRRDGCPLVSRVGDFPIPFIGPLFMMGDWGSFHLVSLFADAGDGVATALQGRRIGDQLSRLEKLPLADFVFSREFRGRYAETAAVPAKRIAE